MRTSGAPVASAVESAMALGSAASLALASLNQRSNKTNGSFSANRAASSGGAAPAPAYWGEGGIRSSPDTSTPHDRKRRFGRFVTSGQVFARWDHSGPGSATLG